jgi:non-heme chloroperoxidase
VTASRHPFPPLLLLLLGGVGAGCGAAPRDPARADSTALAPPGPAAPGDTWRDRSPHTVRFIHGSHGVPIEVLDWGGTGPPLVFIPGLENTGHIFDEFALRFTDRFHVLAITRRGWGASGHPATGYTIPILVADVHAVLDSLGLGPVDLVGHSIAGQELTWIAATYPRQVRRLVYLDAGFDYHTHPILTPIPPQPPPTAAESASVPAALAYFRRMNGAPLPEADFRATESISPAGRDLGPATPDSIADEVLRSAETTAPPFARVRAGALAVYDRPLSAAEALPGVDLPDSAASALLAAWLGWRRAQRAEFAARVPHATVEIVRGASHYVFLLQPDTVAREMRAFLLQPLLRTPR